MMKNIEELNLFDLVNKLGYIKWFAEFAEGNETTCFGETVWLDEIKLPVEFNLTLVQKFFREKHNTHIEIRLGHDENKIWYNWSMFNITTKDYNYDPHLTNEKDGFDYYELALYDALMETSMFLLNLPI